MRSCPTDRSQASDVKRTTSYMLDRSNNLAVGPVTGGPRHQFSTAAVGRGACAHARTVHDRVPSSCNMQARTLHGLTRSCSLLLRRIWCDARACTTCHVRGRARRLFFSAVPCARRWAARRAHVRPCAHARLARACRQVRQPEEMRWF